MELKDIAAEAAERLVKHNEKIKNMFSLKQFGAESKELAIRELIVLKLITDLGAPVALFHVNFKKIDFNSLRFASPVTVYLQAAGYAPIVVWYPSLLPGPKPSLNVPIYAMSHRGDRNVVANLNKFHKTDTIEKALILAEIEGRKLQLGISFKYRSEPEIYTTGPTNEAECTPVSLYFKK
jgi:hypothetical protein